MKVLLAVVAVGKIVLDAEAAGAGMGHPKRLVQIRRRLFSIGAKVQGEGESDAVGAGPIDEFERLADAVFVILEGPAFDHAAAIGKDNVIKRGVDNLLLLGGG